MKLIIFGMIIGVANIIPGVSGGTMAVILGIYDKIISSISNIKRDFAKSLKFLIPIGIGAVFGIVLFSKLIEYTLEHYNVATNMVFVGLIIGSVPMIYSSAKKQKSLKISDIVVFILTLALMLVMKFITPAESSVINDLTIGSFLKIFLSSIIAAGAMIIPGISGSFIMLLLGVYTTVLAAISDFNILILIPVGLGCIVGIIGFAKIIEKLFENFKSQTYFGILGFMLGSIVVIFPCFIINAEFFISIILLILASVTAYLFSKK